MNPTQLDEGSVMGLPCYQEHPTFLQLVMWSSLVVINFISYGYREINPCHVSYDQMLCVE